MGNHNSNVNNKQTYYSVEYLNGEFGIGLGGNSNEQIYYTKKSFLDNSSIIDDKDAYDHSNYEDNYSENKSNSNRDDRNLIYSSSSCSDSSRKKKTEKRRMHKENENEDEIKKTYFKTSKKNNSHNTTPTKNSDLNNYEMISNYRNVNRSVDNLNNNLFKEASFKMTINDEKHDLNSTHNMLGLLRNGAVLVQRSKSYVRPENKVLPIEFPTRPLRQTNMLKTEGMKRTWRNNNKNVCLSTLKSNIKKNNSTIIIAGNKFNFNNNFKEPIRDENDIEDNYKTNYIIKPSLIKSLINKSTQNTSNLQQKHFRERNNKDNDATSNDELTDFDDENLKLENYDHQENYVNEDWLSDSKETRNSTSYSKEIACSSSVDNLKSIRNEIKNYREKYSRSMGNIDTEWHSDIDEYEFQINHNLDDNMIRNLRPSDFKEDKKSANLKKSKSNASYLSIKTKSSSKTTNTNSPKLSTWSLTSKSKSSKTNINNNKSKNKNNATVMLMNTIKKSSILSNPISNQNKSTQTLNTENDYSKKFKSKSFLSHITSYKQNMENSNRFKLLKSNHSNNQNSSNNNDYCLSKSNKRIDKSTPTSTSPSIKNGSGIAVKTSVKLVNKLKSINNLSHKINNGTNNANNNNDIKIISRFPINSKIYRHYIAGNGNKMDKLTNSVDLKNLIKNDSKKCEKMKIVAPIINERAIDVNKFNNQMTNDSDYDPTYDSIDDFTHTHNNKNIIEHQSIEKTIEMNHSTTTTSTQSPKSITSIGALTSRCDSSSRPTSSPSSSSSSPYYNFNSDTDEVNKKSYKINAAKENILKANCLDNKNNNIQFFSSAASSSVFSGLTSSSLLPPSPNNSSNNVLLKGKLNNLFDDSENEDNNCTNDNSYDKSVNLRDQSGNSYHETSINDDYNNNFNFNSSHEKNNTKYIEESIYEILSNTNSGNYYKINISCQSDKQTTSKNSLEKSKDRHVIEKKIIESRKQIKRVDEVKQALLSNIDNFSKKEILNCESDLKNNKVNIKSKIDAFENININNAIQNDFKSSKAKKSELDTMKLKMCANVRIKENEIRKNSNLKEATSREKKKTSISQCYKENKNNDLNKFYLRPPSNYDDDHELFLKKPQHQSPLSFSPPQPTLSTSSSECENDDYDTEKSNLLKSEFSDQIENLSCFDFIDLIDCKEKYSFRPEKEKEDNMLEYNFQSSMRLAPPPPEFDNTISSFKYKKYFQDAEKIHSKNNQQITNYLESNSDCTPNTTSSCDNGFKSDESSYVADKYNNFDNFNNINDKDSNFILKPKEIKSPAMQFLGRDKNNSKVDENIISSKKNKKASKSVIRNRRKGLDEVFPGIKLSKSDYDDQSSSSNCTSNSNTKTYRNETDSQNNDKLFNIQDPNWCPASDLCDFDQEENSNDLKSSINKNNKKSLKNIICKHTSSQSKTTESNLKFSQHYQQLNQTIQKVQHQYQSRPNQPANENTNRKKIVRTNLNYLDSKHCSEIFIPVKNLNTFYY